jgi:hypothetical protein
VRNLRGGYQATDIPTATRLTSGWLVIPEQIQAYPDFGEQSILNSM